MATCQLTWFLVLLNITSMNIGEKPWVLVRIMGACNGPISTSVVAKQWQVTLGVHIVFQTDLRPSVNDCNIMKCSLVLYEVLGLGLAGAVEILSCLCLCLLNLKTPQQHTFSL